MNGTHGITICKRGEGNQYVRSKLLIGHHHTVKSLLYHPSKNILVSCGLEGIFIWDLDTCTALTVDSLVSVLNALQQLDEGTSYTCTIGSDNLAKLSDQQKAIATNKGWTLN